MSAPILSFVRNIDSRHTVPRHAVDEQISVVVELSIIEHFSALHQQTASPDKFTALIALPHG